MAPGHGFEPRLTQSECAVLPLDDGAIIRNWDSSIAFSYKCQQHFFTIKEIIFSATFFRRLFNRKAVIFLT